MDIHWLLHCTSLGIIFHHVSHHTVKLKSLDINSFFFYSNNQTQPHLSELFSVTARNIHVHAKPRADTGDVDREASQFGLIKNNFMGYQFRIYCLPPTRP